VSEAQQRFLTGEAETEELRRRCKHLERELQQEAEGHHRTEQKLLAWERENATARARIDELEESTSKLRHEHSVALAHEQQLWSKEREGLEASVREAAKLGESVRATAGSTREQMTKEWEDKVSVLKAEHSKKIHKLEGEIAQRDRELGGARRDAERREEEGKSALEELRMRVSSLQERIVGLEEDKRALSDRLGQVRVETRSQTIDSQP
jgi:chromosome segregation ATPase